jgi:hypothetical protein
LYSCAALIAIEVVARNQETPMVRTIILAVCSMVMMSCGVVAQEQHVTDDQHADLQKKFAKACSRGDGDAMAAAFY